MSEFRDRKRIDVAFNSRGQPPLLISNWPQTGVFRHPTSVWAEMLQATDNPRKEAAALKAHYDRPGYPLF